MMIETTISAHVTAERADTYCRICLVISNALIKVEKYGKVHFSLVAQTWHNRKNYA